jgi:hypothetical protein
MLYAILTVGVVAFATVIMLGMDASSRAQGGRFYIALAAIAVLLGLDKLSGARREDAALSLLVLLFAGSLLIGLALNLP